MNEPATERHWHRFAFAPSTPFGDCEALLRLASFATEGLCGDGATAALPCRLDPDERAIEIDLGRHAGRILVAVFRAYVRREFGDEGLVEDRVLIPTPETR